MTSNDDAELVERLMRRDEGALRYVIATYGSVVHGMARRTVVDPALAEEVAQDAFVALWRRPGAFDPARGSLRSFLVGVARNKGIDLVRREESRRRTKETLTAEMEATSREAVGTEQMDEVDQRREVVEALSSLSPSQREAIVLAYFGGRTYREVAEELKIPEGTAKTRLRDGLMRLREVLENREDRR